jgi:hypothetical protein
MGTIVVICLALSRKQPINYPPRVNNAPTINTVTLPDATMGVPYTGEIFTSILGSHETLELNISHLPDGLKLTDCTQHFDSRIIPVPNTIRACSITGTPRASGTFQLAVTARIANERVDSVTTIPLNVAGQ